MNTFGRLYKIEFVCKDTRTGKRHNVVDYVTSPTEPTVQSEQELSDKLNGVGHYVIMERTFRTMPVDKVCI